ncbi:FtsX-like permease family protein [Oceanobacillus sp. 143]|uniref:Peptide ABC transporter permease n=1 Tax=Oceanobacillus zhaokaii TaxID=2052660 RepID=A0A345PL52_9BACI|nr:ABC transporter permease [Oceanobacillus zhaokaii]AXI10732.1 peptide ABC transporter permease [Oceanobacillus zhaokaii]QGS69660.1 FtsX-like permease family protein [Oceanobacillus sp. 143]
MLENIRASFQSIWNHKLRSVLTMLGVIIGIAAVIAIFAIIEGGSEELKSNLIGMGKNTINVVYEEADMYGEEGMYGGEVSNKAAPPIKEEAIEEILTYPNVSGMSVYHEGWNEVYHLMNISHPRIYGVDERYFDMFEASIVEGRTFSEEDYESYSQVALINEMVLTELFPEGDALNQSLDISGTPFRVVGVFTNNNGEKDNEWYYEEPIIYLPKTIWPIINGFDAPMQVAVQADSSDAIQEVGTSIAGRLNEDLPPFDTAIYQVADFERMMEEMGEYNRIFAFILGGIASISLLVGGIGVMNIMLVSVTERTQEIGIKKALGAKRHVILAQFLTESIVLTSLGGIVGILLGIGIAKIVSEFANMPFFVSIPAVVGSFVFSMLIGIIFGLLPSIRASKLQPVEALRHD